MIFKGGTIQKQSPTLTFGFPMNYAKTILLFPILLLTSVLAIEAQDLPPVASDFADDGTPMIVKNLPGPESVQATAVWAKTIQDVEGVVGPQQILDLVSLVRGVEAAAAVYPEGKVLLVEYPTPQFATEADAKFQERLIALSGGPAIRYRRIGNYCAFVFDATDDESANKLLDQIRYAKTVQWLGEDPNYQLKVERYLALSLGNVFIGTLVASVIGVGLAVGLGLIIGIAYFKIEEKKRAARRAFSDAGGMTRLNLDEMTEDVESKEA